MTWLFFLNLFLALVYVALTGELTVWSIVVGFVLGYVILTLYCRAVGIPSYGGKIIRLIRFAGWFFWKLITANVEVAYEILTPTWIRMRPRIIRYPVHDLTDVQLTTFANAISLTPGTLSTDVDETRRLLYVHCMWGDDRERAIRDLDELKSRLIEEVFES